MTAQQPEYIITADELTKLKSWSTHKSPAVCQYERRLEILKQVEARPHTPTPEKINGVYPEREGNYTAWEMQEAEALGFNRGNGAAWEYAEKKARAATLAAYDKFLDEIRNEDFDNLRFIDMDSIEATYIKLRQAQEHP